MYEMGWYLVVGSQYRYISMLQKGFEKKIAHFHSLGLTEANMSKVTASFQISKFDVIS